MSNFNNQFTKRKKKGKELNTKYLVYRIQHFVLFIRLDPSLGWKQELVKTPGPFPEIKSFEVKGILVSDYYFINTNNIPYPLHFISRRHTSVIYNQEVNRKRKENHFNDLTLHTLRQTSVILTKITQSYNPQDTYLSFQKTIKYEVICHVHSHMTIFDTKGH